jgi:hypothetical protein
MRFDVLFDVLDDDIEDGFYMKKKKKKFIFIPSVCILLCMYSASEYCELRESDKDIKLECLSFS